MIDQDSLKKGLMQDLAGAEQQQAQTSVALGAPDESDFKAKAFRMKNRKVGQEELASLNLSISNAVRDLTAEAGLLDMGQQGLFQNKMNRKMHQMKMVMIKQAGEWQKELARRGYDKQQQLAFWKGVSSLMGGVGEGVIGQLGPKNTETAVGTGGGLMGPASAIE